MRKCTETVPNSATSSASSAKLARLSLRTSPHVRVSNAYLSQVERGIHEPSLWSSGRLPRPCDVPLQNMVPSDGAASSGDREALGDAIRADRLLTRRREASTADHLPLPMVASRVDLAAGAEADPD